MADLVMGAKTGGSAADMAYLANRAAVGEHFALTKGLNDQDAGRDRHVGSQRR